MTFGPIEPSMTGNSIDLPLALSVNVIVPAGTMTLGVLPSIDAPQCFRPQAVAGSGAENRLPGADYQTSFGFCNAISHMRRAVSLRRAGGRVGDPRQGLVAAEHFHDFEDAGRGDGAGQRDAQRLRRGAEFDGSRCCEVAQP